jgi:hypothetical protein
VAAAWRTRRSTPSSVPACPRARVHPVGTATGGDAGDGRSVHHVTRGTAGRSRGTADDASRPPGGLPAVAVRNPCTRGWRPAAPRGRAGAGTTPGYPGTSPGRPGLGDPRPGDSAHADTPRCPPTGGASPGRS